MPGTTRINKAIDKRNKLIKKRQVQSLEKLEKIKSSLEKYQVKTTETLAKLSNSLDTVKDYRTQDDKKKEMKVVAKKAVKQKAYIVDYTQKAVKEFDKTIQIISNYGDSEAAVTSYQAIQALFRTIESHQTTAFAQMEKIEQLITDSIGAKAGEALIRLEESMPSPAGYYIFQKEVCHVEKLSEEQVISLAKDGTVRLKKITKKQFEGISLMAKWPKGWFYSPVDFLKNIFKAKAEAHAEFSTSKTSTEIAIDGYLREFDMEFKAVADVIIQFTQIVIEANIKGSITLMVGHSGNIGTFSLKSEACIEAAVWAKANLKSLNVSVGAAVTASLESTIGFESKAVEIGGHKLSFDLNAVFKAYGKAQAVAAAGAMMLAKQDNLIKGSEEGDVIGSYAGQDKKTLGDKAIEGTFGVAAGAWAGVGVAVELIGSVNCEINGIRTKLIGISEEFHIEFGIGGKVDINLQHSTEKDDTTGNEYDQIALTIGLNCMAGAEFVTTISIWKKLYQKTFEALKDFSLNETKAYMKPHVKECRDKATNILSELIGGAIKQAAQKIINDLEESWDVSKTKHTMMTILDKLGHHELALQNKTKEHHLNLEREKARLKTLKTKLKNLVVEQKEAMATFDEINAQYKELAQLSEKEFEEQLVAYFEKIKALFGENAISDEILTAAQEKGSQEDALLLIQSKAIEEERKLAKLMKKYQTQMDSLNERFARAAALTKTYNDYLEKHHKRHLQHAFNKLKQINAVLETLESAVLEESQKQIFKKNIGAIFEDIRLINQITGNRQMLLNEANNDDYISKQLYKAMDKSNKDIQTEQKEVIKSIQELFIALNKLDF